MTQDETRPLVHRGIETLKPYVPGKPIEDVARELGLSKIVKLASNENPFGPSPKAVARMRAIADQMHRYPDGPALALRDKLATLHGLQPEQLFFGSGSNELLELALKTFTRPGDTVVSASVTFAVYGILAQAHGCDYATAPMHDLGYDLDALAQLACDRRARLVFVANPNNPTGTAFPRAEMLAFLAQLPDETLVVYDAAYAEYAEPDVSDGLDLIAEDPRLLVTRTFSKAHGLAGLRVGWGFAQPRLADYINRVRQPFNLNRMGQEAALAALDDTAFLAKVIEQNRRSVAYLRQALEGMGLQTWPSQANFVLFETPLAADTLFDHLLHQGVIVRSMRGFGLPNHIRVNTGTDEENDFFLQALQRVLQDR